VKVKGSAPPLVVVGNIHDFATVYPWSQSVAKQLGATLVTYEAACRPSSARGTACRPANTAWSIRYWHGGGGGITPWRS
jgi:hypothetical protein